MGFGIKVNGIYLTYLTNKNTLCFPFHEIKKVGKKSKVGILSKQEMYIRSAGCVCKQVRETGLCSQFSLQHWEMVEVT